MADTTDDNPVVQALMDADAPDSQIQNAIALQDTEADDQIGVHVLYPYKQLEKDAKDSKE